MSLASITGKLSRTEMKKIMAGSGGQCIGCYGGTPGMYSCWYTNSGCDVCSRVYPSHPECFGVVGCGGCTMN